MKSIKILSILIISIYFLFIKTNVTNAQPANIPTLNLSASPISVPSGTASTLTWSVTNATGCQASGDWSGPKNITGGSESTGPLTKNSSFNLTCVNQSGSVSKTASVNVSSASAVTINLTANPSSISAGGTTTISWAVSGAVTNSCTASGGWSGSRALSGSETTGPLAGTTQFFLECTGATGFQTNSVTVTINTGANPPPSSQLCPDGKSISTGIGCIPINNFNALAGTLIRIAIGIGGGIAFVLIAYSGIIIANSTGDPKKLQSGQDLFSAAVSGLLLIIFSIFILRIIGISIFNLPGFGL